jgi:two-component system response regulator PilR (NtrC family)
MKRILIVDDEEVLRDILEALVRKQGHNPILAKTGEEALMILDREEIDLVLLDLMLPGMSGLEVLSQIRTKDPDQVVVVITAYSSIEGAIEAMRGGAFHYIPKPFKNEEVRLVVSQGLERRSLKAENRALKEQLRQRFGFDNIIGKSKPMQEVFDLVRLAAPSKSNILVTGESGTGKELVAKAIHHHSRRAGGPFVTVNSGSMPPDLLESNLFGHVKGAFTGAVSSKKGLFEMADDGSIFFDEIGNVPMETQAKLLRVIQEKEFMRLGGTETLKADVRIIAATNADLEEEVRGNRFREDLYYRLNVISIRLPSLRSRTEDIPLLAQHFLARYTVENDKPLAAISPAAMELLIDYPWPGNVRELENAIERAVVLSSGEVLDVELLPQSVRQPGSGLSISPPTDGINGMSLKEAVSSYERQLIVKALQTAGGVQKRAAEMLQVKPTTLHEMMKRLNVSSDSVVAAST